MGDRLKLEDRIPCEVDGCNVNFARLADSRRHVRECRGPRIYCPEPDCSWGGTKRKDRLERHLSKVHSDMQKVVLNVPEEFGATTESSPKVFGQVTQPQNSAPGTALPLKANIFHKAELKYLHHQGDNSTISPDVLSPILHIKHKFEPALNSRMKLGNVSETLLEEHVRNTQLSLDGSKSFESSGWDSAFDCGGLSNSLWDSTQMLSDTSALTKMAESLHVSLDSACRAKASINQAYGNDNNFRMDTGKCLEATKNEKGQSLTMSVRENTSIYSQHFDSPREEFLDKVFEEAGSFTSQSPTTSSGSQGRSNGRQTNATPLSSLPSYASQNTTASNKKRHRGDDEEDCGSPNRTPNGERPGPKYTYGQNRYRYRRLACPFYLSNREVYCKNKGTGKKYETCSGPGWSAMHHLEQHLGNSAGSVRKKIRCPRCLNAFKQPVQC